MEEICASGIIARRLAANGLSLPFDGPIDCVRGLVGIQSQFQQWAEVSIMNRCPPDLGMEDLAALYTRHEIINLWGQRHTLHMYAREDWTTISDLYEPVVAGASRAYRRFAEDFHFLMDRIARETSTNHAISRAGLLAMIKERMQGRHAPDDYLEYTFMALACLRGVIFGLPEKPAIRQFIGRPRLFGQAWQEDRERSWSALADILLRYFRHYGPATLADFSHWSGLAQRTARPALAAIRDQLEVISFEGREYLACETPAAEPPESGLFLLGKFDPLFLSYRHKEWIVPAKLQKLVWRNAGWIEGVIIDGNRAAGTWRHSLQGKKMSVRVSSFDSIKAASRKKIQARAERLAAFWEKRLDRVEFT